MACTWALTLVALCFGTVAANMSHRSLRGHHRHHSRPNRRKLSFDDLHPPRTDPGKEDPAQENMAPLYDDFLDVMNDAAAKALSQQRAIPAYDDFLHLMKGSAEKAYHEQAGPPSYDQFLNFMKGKTDEAYHQQAHLPSYDDFLMALKESSVEALKDPVPTYEQFLTVLKDGANRAMDKRIHQTMEGEAIMFKRQNPLDKAMDKRIHQTMEGEAIVLKRQNPLDKVMDQVQGKKHDDDEESKLKEELRQLQDKKRGAPGHQKKPLMKRINVLRTQLCWKRPNLWQHEKCLRFLGIHCLQESTGEGICRAFTKEATKRCETSKNKDFKEDYCALSEALSDDYGEDDDGTEAITEEGEDEITEEGDDEHEEDEGEDEDHAEEDEHGHKVGSDEDLDEDLDEMDDDLLGDKASGAAHSDRDGDGVSDDKDKFPDDPKEWKDTDEDGIGDNADTDLDGDGHNNDVDVFPADKNEWLDSDNDGIGDNADKDRDNDGVNDDKDKFPDDPSEWFDTDGDGVGDNKDAYPYNPNCHSHDEPCLELGNSTEPKPGSPQDPSTLDMDALRPLPEQGYSEHHSGPYVNHENYYTWVGDWQEEFPEMVDSERSVMDKICKDHPENSWCKKFKGRDSHFR